MTTFPELGLSPILLSALEKSGYITPTPVQARAIPAAMEGADLLVCAQTGSGKTAAFMLPALHKLLLQEPKVRPFIKEMPSKNGRNHRSRSPQKIPHVTAKPSLLVLSPTRELALQVTEAAQKYAGQARHIKTVAILGGMPYPKQLELLARDPDILVATPGRLIDHIKSGKIDLSALQMLVFDEADRMLDMGFIEDIEFIVAKANAARQTLLFSATLDGEVGRIAVNMTQNPKTIRVDTPQTRHDNISQRLHFVDDLSHKNRLLDHLLSDENLSQAIVFTATKRDADTLSDRLNLLGFQSAPLHGDIPQARRNRTLTAMKRQDIKILVATDVAARGIDVPSISHVVNYDLPMFAEDYVHRIGRTGRAGRAGIAISLVRSTERFAVRKIERYTQQEIPVSEIAGLEPKSKPSFADKKKKPGFSKTGGSRFEKGFAKKPASGSASTNSSFKDFSEKKKKPYAEKSTFAGHPSTEALSPFSKPKERGVKDFHKTAPKKETKPEGKSGFFAAKKKRGFEGRKSV